MAARASITPIDSPRDFRVDEMFFSTTDRKGIILSGNEVFMRISAYPAAQLLGQPHNLIRHPDMPKAIFRLVWAHLKQGKSVAGYIKNMAADGRYYWVFAVLTPLRDGYLSVRFKPTSDAFTKIAPLYREMLQTEAEALARGLDANAIMDASSALLDARLQALGHPDYETFMVAMLHIELKSRDEMILRQGARLLPPQIDATGISEIDRMRAIYARCKETYQEINCLYAELDEYARLQLELRARFASVVDSASEFQLTAMNATIKSAHLGGQGQCIGVIAGQLGEISQQIATISTALTTRMKPVTAGLKAVILNLAAARLQLEMIMMFCHELAALGTSGVTNANDVDDLQTSLEGTIQLAVAGLRAAEEGLSSFGGEAEAMHRHTLTMQVVQIGGAVEASRLQDGDSLAQTFLDVREKTDASKATQEELSDVITRFGQLARAAPAIVSRIISAVELTREDLKVFLDLITDLPKGAVPAPTEPRPLATPNSGISN